MSSSSKIGWTDRTWNPLLGCKKVSEGCDRCYAIVQAWIRSFNPNPKIAEAFSGLVVKTPAGLEWTGQVNLPEQRLTEPFGWIKPQRVFINSLSDVFYKEVPEDFIARLWAAMALTPHVTYQLLTKRHARLRAVLSSPRFAARYEAAYDSLAAGLRGSRDGRRRRLGAQLRPTLPVANVWVGVSAENQVLAERRIPVLLRTPAAVRWVSAEPLVGPVDLRALRLPSGHVLDALTGATVTAAGHPLEESLARLDWVVTGGESGGMAARPMHPAWARSLRDQCLATGTALFFKQWGEWGPASWRPARRAGEGLEEFRARARARAATHVARTVRGGLELHEADSVDSPAERDELPSDAAAMRRWGRAAAGSELDGREWIEFPDEKLAAA